MGIIIRAQSTGRRDTSTYTHTYTHTHTHTHTHATHTLSHTRLHTHTHTHTFTYTDASATVDEVSSSEWVTGWYNSYGHYYKGTIDR